MNEERYEPEVYVIPVNISDNGYAIWRIKKRNLIEAIALGAIAYMIWTIAFGPFDILVRTVSGIFIMGPVILLAITGVRGESLLEFLIEYIFFIKKKRKMVFRIPREELKRKERRLFAKKDLPAEDAGLSAEEKKKLKAEGKAEKIRLKERKKQDAAYIKEKARREKAYAKQLKKQGKEVPVSMTNDRGSVGWVFFSFIFSLVGLILFFVWRKEKPNTARKLLIGEIAKLVFAVLLAVAYIVVLMVMGLSVTDIWTMIIH